MSFEVDQDRTLKSILGAFLTAAIGLAILCLLVGRLITLAQYPNDAQILSARVPNVRTAANPISAVAGDYAIAFGIVQHGTYETTAVDTYGYLEISAAHKEYDHERHKNT